MSKVKDHLISSNYKSNSDQIYNNSYSYSQGRGHGNGNLYGNDYGFGYGNEEGGYARDCEYYGVENKIENLVLDLFSILKNKI